MLPYLQDSALVPRYVDAATARRWSAAVRKQVRFLPRTAPELQVNMYGKQLPLPRDKQFYGDHAVHPEGAYDLFPCYRYSGNDLHHPTILSWEDAPVLVEIRDHLYQQTGQYCNHVVVNRYRNGEDHVGWHKDKNRDFVPGSCVLTVSLDAVRTFELQPIPEGEEERETEPKEHGIASSSFSVNATVSMVPARRPLRRRSRTGKTPIVSMQLPPGSLFVLGPETNDRNKHRIKPQKGRAGQLCGERTSLTYRWIGTWASRTTDGALCIESYTPPAPTQAAAPTESLLDDEDAAAVSSSSAQTDTGTSSDEPEPSPPSASPVHADNCLSPSGLPIESIDG